MISGIPNLFNHTCSSDSLFSIVRMKYLVESISSDTKYLRICLDTKVQLRVASAYNTEAYSEPCQMSKMWIFRETVTGRKPLIVFA